MSNIELIALNLTTEYILINPLLIIKKLLKTLKMIKLY